MLSDQYKRQMVFNEFAAQTAQTAAVKILKAQALNVGYYYNERTGHIRESLNAGIASIQKSGSGVNLSFDYLIDLRFLDIKTTALGKKKKLYGPVYNRPLWGIVYGYLFGSLRYGLTEQVQAQILDEIRKSIKTLDRNEL